MIDLTKSSSTQIDVRGRPWRWYKSGQSYVVLCDNATVTTYKTQAKADARIKTECEKFA